MKASQLYMYAHTEQISNVSEKLDQVLYNQAKMKDTIYSIKQSQKEDRQNFERNLKKVENEKACMTSKLNTLTDQYNSLKQKLDEKEGRMKKLMQANANLKTQLNQRGNMQLHSTNDAEINQLKNDIVKLKSQLIKVEKENTELKRNCSFFLRPHPRASEIKTEQTTFNVACASYQSIHRKKADGIPNNKTKY